MEQRIHLIVSDESGLVTDRCGKIAVEISNRRLNSARDATARNRVVHPRSAALRRSRIKIEIELADQCAIAVLNIEEAHVGMPFGDSSIGRHYLQSIQSLDQAEHAWQHSGLRKILFHFLIRKSVACNAQL